MSWLSESYTRHSDKNGTVRVTRWFGRWTVHYGDFEYTSPYLHDMWRQAIKKLLTKKQRQQVHNVLMLGLAAGGEIKTLHTSFPGCDLTVVEYDPEMVALAKELKLYEPFPFPRTLTEDAATAVPKLTGKSFDFIIIDLFSGPTPSPLSKNKEFLQSLHAVLAEDGHVLVNVFRENEAYFETMSHIFEHKQFWTYKYNLLGLFTKGHGSV